MSLKFNIVSVITSSLCTGYVIKLLLLLVVVVVALLLLLILLLLLLQLFNSIQFINVQA
jgi:hypothetical protein